jgi:hypothetical protein
MGLGTPPEFRTLPLCESVAAPIRNHPFPTGVRSSSAGAEPAQTSAEQREGLYGELQAYALNNHPEGVTSWDRRRL